MYGGGVLSPGASPGKLTIDGDLSIDQFGVLKLELAGTTPGLFDQLEVTGDLSILGTIKVSLLGGFKPQAGDLFKFFDVGGTLDLSQATFALPPGINFETVAPGEFRVVGVPEPSSLLLLTAALGAVALCRRGERAA